MLLFDELDLVVLLSFADDDDVDVGFVFSVVDDLEEVADEVVEVLPVFVFLVLSVFFSIYTFFSTVFSTFLLKPETLN